MTNYLGGTTQPSLLWLKEASDVLSVRQAWLADGEGQMKERDRTGVGADGGAPDVWGIFEKCAGPDFTAKAHGIIVASWWNAVMLVLNSCPEREEPTDEEVEVIGRWVFRQAISILKPIRGKHTETSRRDFNLYFSLVFQAIAYGAPLLGQGMGKAELIRRLTLEGSNDG
jgi:hypothetical protein